MCISVLIAGLGVTSAGAANSRSSIKIGYTTVVGSAEGTYAGALASAKAAVRGINASGGVNGHPLKLVFCNNEFTVPASTACANQFVSQHVVAMVGSTDPFGETQITSVLQAAGIPQIGTNDLAQWLGAPNEFPILLYTPSTFGDLAACSKLGYTKVGITGTNNSFGQSLTANLFESAKKLPNIKIVSGSSKITVPSTATTVTPEAQELISDGANCIDITADFPTQETLLLEALDSLNAPAGTHVVFGTAGVTPSTLSGSIATLAQKYAIGVSMFPGLSDKSNKIIKQFISDVQAEAKSGDSKAPVVSDNTAVRDEDFQSWIAVRAAATVMEQKKVYTPKAIMSVLQSNHCINLGPLVPCWNPTAAGTKTFPRMPDPNYYVIGYTAGKTLESHLLLPKPIDVLKYAS